MSLAPPTRWLHTVAPLLISDWDDTGERTVYHPASNDTHYLNPLGALVLDVLAAAPPGITLDELLPHLVAATDDPALTPDQLRPHVAAVLARFVDVGLATATA